MLPICVVPTLLKKIPPDDVDARLTTWPPAAALTGLPLASSNCTVIWPESTPAMTRSRST